VHYEVRVNGKPINPNKIKSTKSNPMPSDQRARFDKLVQAHLYKMQAYLYSEL
jgi:hypothetical protein